MKILFCNRYSDAFAKTILCFASIHLIILVWVAIQGNIYVLNAFSILGLNTFNPGLGHGMLNFVLSYCLVLAGYFCVYLFLARPVEEKEPKPLN